MAEDRAALLRELHDVHAPSLWRFVVRLTGDDRFAEDVVQETLLRAWRRPQILTEDEAGARAWLFTVARNLVIDHRRSARVNREVASDALPERPSADHANAVLDAWLVADSLAYREWDAAYLLGALSATDRRAYEEHLAGCRDCTAEVAALAGVPGTLAVLRDDNVAANDRSVAAISGPPPNLLPGLVRSVQQERRRQRRRLAAVMAGVAATAAAIGALVAGPLAGGEPQGEYVVLAQTVASKLSADARLVEEHWGTTIEISCRYDELATPSERVRGYELYVTDKSGKATLVASWSASPGSTVKPAATTKLRRGETRALDIRSSESGRVLLAVHF